MLNASFITPKLEHSAECASMPQLPHGCMRKNTKGLCVDVGKAPVRALHIEAGHAS
jgi:hypothetical protein